MWHCMNGKYLNDVFALVRIKHSTYMMLLLIIFRDFSVYFMVSLKNLHEMSVFLGFCFLDPVYLFIVSSLLILFVFHNLYHLPGP